MRRTAVISLLSLVTVLVLAPHAHATPPSMALDGHAASSFYGCAGDCAFASITTTHAPDVVVIVAQCGLFFSCTDNITSITDDDHHNWTLRAAYLAPTLFYPHGRPVWEYYTIAKSPLSADRINITLFGPMPYVGFVVFAVSGANTQHPWDPSRGLPAEEAIGSGCVDFRMCTISFSPVAAQDFVIVSTAINDDQNCQGISPFQKVDSAVYGQAETDYFVTRLGGSNAISFTCTDSSPVTLLGDALQGPTSV